MKPTIFTEQLDLSEAQMDHDARMLRNVVLIRAGTSGNRRHYSEQVLVDALPIFEGIKAYDGHERRGHKVADTTGWYTGVRFENGALRADRYFSGTQAGRDVQSIAEDIVSGRAPRTLAGLSINASGRGKIVKQADGDVIMVESITKAESVDDVDTPAAGGAYLEQAGGDDLAAALIEAFTYEEFLEARPDYVERLRKEFKRVRQEDALKSAEAETQRLTDELQEAQTAATQLSEQRDTALTQLHEAQRALAIETTLNDPKVKLPASWREALRQQLQDAPAEQWGAVIESEQRKAKSAETRRVNVSGADQQVMPTLTESTSGTRAPNWKEIMSSLEAFRHWQEQMQRG